MENKIRKIPMKNFRSDLACIFKSRLDRFGYSSWQELADKVGIESGRCYIDFFMGKQTLSKEVLEKTFEVLDIPIETLEFYVDKHVRYSIKKAKGE